LLSVVVYLRKFSPRAGYLIVIFVIAEISLFAGSYKHTFSLDTLKDPQIERLEKEHVAGCRVLDIGSPNRSITSRMSGVWGSNSVILTQRYNDLYDYLSQIDKLSRNRLFGMLRVKYYIEDENGKSKIYRNQINIMPRLNLIDDYLLINNRTGIFEMLGSKLFDPAKTVILEEKPVPEPVKSNVKGSAKIIDSSTDCLTIEAEVSSATLLLITDAYSEGWKAKALEGSIQNEYKVLPANYILQAVPLKAGRHKILMEYAPDSFYIGKWITIISLFVFLTFVVVQIFRAIAGLTHSRKEAA
jgi:hypothetical protein